MPKKYRKKGSSVKGELGVRTTCSEEILATPFTACPAMPVKSGPPRSEDGAGAGASMAVVAGAGDAGISRVARFAFATDAVRVPAVRTSPATKAATTSAMVSESRLIMGSIVNEIEDCKFKIEDFISDL